MNLRTPASVVLLMLTQRLILISRYPMVMIVTSHINAGCELAG